MPRTSAKTPATTMPIAYVPLCNQLGVFEHLRLQLNAACRNTLGALRANPGRAESSTDTAILVETRLLEQEDVLHGDHLALHPGDLGDRRDLAGAVGETRDLHDDL